MHASPHSTLASAAVAIAAVSLFACFPLGAFSATRCEKPAIAEARAIHQSFERTLLPALEGEPAAGPLFLPCIIRHEDYGRYVLLDFSAEGFYGGNNWGRFWAFGRFDENGPIVWLAAGTSGGNPPPTYRVSEVRQDNETRIIWHDAQCVTLSYRCLVVPPGANMAFPDIRWKKVGIEHSFCGKCGESTHESCVRKLNPNGLQEGELVTH